MGEPALSARDIAVSFGGVRAVDGVSVEVAAGGSLAVVGPNGSGKSTLLNAISGLVPAAGRLAVAGRVVRLGDPRRTRRAGVLRGFQTPQCFAELTCLENVLLAEPDRRATGLAGAFLGRPAMMRRERSRWARGMAMLELVGLAGLAGVPGGGLTHGQQRRLEIARCLAGEPRVLLLDEPSAGLNDAETRDLGDLLCGLRRPDLALVVVDHKIDFLERLCDRFLVLELGAVVAAGTAAQVWADPRVVAAFLGGGPDEFGGVGGGPDGLGGDPDA